MTGVLTKFVISEQSQQALSRLGLATDNALDPKQTLLDAVQSAHRQRQVWEALLANVPPQDFELLGSEPGLAYDPRTGAVLNASRGVRIEVIQKFLLEATKVAARTSKLAIDAGIEERLVRLAEEQSALIADTVRAGLLAGISALFKANKISQAAEAAMIETAMSASAQHLRQLAAGQLASQNDGATEIVEGIAKVIER